MWEMTLFARLLAAGFIIPAPNHTTFFRIDCRLLFMLILVFSSLSPLSRYIASSYPSLKRKKARPSREDVALFSIFSTFLCLNFLFIIATTVNLA